MAQGDVTLFQHFLTTLGKSQIDDLDTGTFKLALVTSTLTPTTGAADPRFGAGGSTNFSTNEVSAGGNYTAGGTDITSTWSQTSGLGTFDGSTNPNWAQNGSNPTNARWGILYDDAASKYCIGFVDLGSDFDMTTGDLTVTWNASGIFTIGTIS